MNNERCLKELAAKAMQKQIELLNQVYIMLCMPQGAACDLFRLQVKNAIENHFIEIAALSLGTKKSLGDVF